MTAKNRPELIGKLHTELKKHFKPAPPSPGRPLMEHVLYASLLEDTPADLADEGFAKCEQEYFDWNEVRVTTVTELAEVLSRLPAANAAAMRLKKNLQSIFEAFYNFDIDYLKKENLGKAVAKFEAMAGISPFVLAYLVQHGLGGHAIPVDASSMKIMELTGIVSEVEAATGKVPGLERVIPKNRAFEFSSLLHQAGIAFHANSKDKVVWDVLLAVNSEAKKIFDRPKSQSKPAKQAASSADDKSQANLASSPGSVSKAAKPTASSTNAHKAVSADKKSSKATASPLKPAEVPVAEKSKGSTTKPAPTKAAPSSPTSTKMPETKLPVTKPTATGKGEKLDTKSQPTKPASAKPLSAKTSIAKPVSTKPEPSSKAGNSKPIVESKSKPVADGRALPTAKPALEKKLAKKTSVEPTKNLSEKKSASAKSTPVQPSSAKPASPKAASEKPVPSKPVPSKPATSKPATSKPISSKPVLPKPDAAKASSKKSEEKPVSKKAADAKLTPSKKGVTSTNKKLTKQKPR